jgi:16S rRNA G966 N2-methylase RsmD
MDALTALNQLEGKKFDIIFADPPYEADLYTPILEAILQKELLTENPKSAAAVSATLIAVTFPVPKRFVIRSLKRLEIMVPTQIIMEIIPA